MIRVDIYAHEAMEIPLIEAFCPVQTDIETPDGNIGRAFSLIHNVAGRGASGSSMGDDVWPETNIELIFYINDDELDEITSGIGRLRRQYPKLGIAMFYNRGYESL